jgi:hypothetical protein
VRDVDIAKKLPEQIELPDGCQTDQRGGVRNDDHGAALI